MNLSCLRIFMLGLALLTPLSYGGILTGPIYNATNGHVYYLLTQNTWAASQAEAGNLGGDLVTIDDAAEQSWVFTNFASFGGVSKALWIGLTDRDTEGVFAWVSERSSSYLNWGRGEPNNSGNEDYVHMNPPGFPNASTWNDLGDVPSFVAGGFTIPLHGVVEVDPVRLNDCVPAAVGLIGWWPGDGNANDLAGGNTGVLVNATNRAGHVNAAFAFTGTNSYVQVPNSRAFDALTNALTLEAWIWHDGNTPPIQRYVTVTPDQAQIRYDNGHFDFPVAVIGSSGSGVVTVRVTSTAQVELRNWYHVVGTYDGKDLRLYVNGAGAGSAVVDRPMAHATTGGTEVFISIAGQGMNGLVDEAAIYNRALSAAEIQSHFAAGRAGMCKVPVFADIEAFFPGIVQLEIKGPPLRSLQVHSSTNLVDWSPLTTISNFTGAVQVSDPLAGAFNRRFYRAFAP